MKKRLLPCAGVLLAGLLVAGRAAAAGAVSAAQLADLSLEQLTHIEVTAVSGRTESLAGAAGSVYVITAEAIRRSGASTLPEALRLAPNLHVARADANQYAISARGFNSTTANKLLVLLDGRTLYSPLFSGVFWEERDVMLEDVERIEVMSGSGGMVWGSNAVNGFINIITRSARDTQGALATVGAGDSGSVAAARYGGATEGGGHYRVYGRRSTRSHTSSAAGVPIRDAAQAARAGFRTDWGDAGQAFTLQGDAYSADIDQGIRPTQRQLAGLNLLGRLTRTFGDGSSLRLQAYIDHTERDQPGSVRDRLDTFDVEVQNSLGPSGSHDVVWGGGYRLQVDRLVNLGPALAFVPASRNLRLANLFVQDAVALREDLELTLGLKLEHNVYTGLEYLPDARLAWKLAPGHLLWGAVSRTVRTPSRIDRELFIPATPPHLVLAGGPDFRSEVAKVLEVGYRGQATGNVSYSVALFHHDFDQLQSIEPSPAGPRLENSIAGSNTGIEAWGSYHVTEHWRLNAGLMRQNLRLHLKPGSASVTGVANLGNDPGHTWSLGSSWDLAPHVQLDMTVRHVGALPSPAVPAYTALNARLGWQVRKDLELSLTAQNLGRRHAEWGTAPGRPEYDRGVFVRLAWGM